MRLRELFENIYEQNGEEYDGSLKTIGVCFGRFNPPHKGHKEVWKAASANPIWYVGTNQNTQGPKDPLPYDVKLQCMVAVWPKVAGHVIPEQSLLTLATRIYEEHGSNVNLKVYTDEDWLVKTLAQYNGVEKEHGMYKFNQIDHIRTERLASATNLRAAVRSGDRDAFYKDMGIKPSVTIAIDDKELPVFDVVAHFLNKYPEPVKKAKKPIPAPLPVEEEFGVGKITAQNTTADVNASTPGKNLRAFKLAEQIQELEEKIKQAKKDSLAENTSGAGYKTKGGMKKISPTQKSAMKSVSTMPGLNMAHGSAYTGWRFGLALAAAPDFPSGGDADSWLGGDPLISTYTEEEYNKVKTAAKQVGAGKIERWSNKRSEELPTTNTKSPVAKPKKNKYGV